MVELELSLLHFVSVRRSSIDMYGSSSLVYRMHVGLFDVEGTILNLDILAWLAVRFAIETNNVLFG